MEQAELLRHVVDTPEEQEIVYLLVGSLASSVYGEPRLTHDIDTGYIDQWTRQLALTEEWHTVLDRLRGP